MYFRCIKSRHNDMTAENAFGLDDRRWYRRYPAADSLAKVELTVGS